VFTNVGVVHFVLFYEIILVMICQTVYCLPELIPAYTTSAFTIRLLDYAAQRTAKSLWRTDGDGDNS